MNPRHVKRSHPCTRVRTRLLPLKRESPHLVTQPRLPKSNTFLHSWFERESAPFVLSVVDSEGLKYQIPKTLREAKLSPQWPMWKQACIDELDSIDKHHTQKLVSRPLISVCYLHIGFLLQR
jgi:hypothetical protein